MKNGLGIFAIISNEVHFFVEFAYINFQIDGIQFIVFASQKTTLSESQADLMMIVINVVSIYEVHELLYFL